jgi:squalene-associated FAD-dependent desaturase
MQAGILPAPFHMTGSFATFAPLTLADKLSIARAMLDIFLAKGHTGDLDQTPAMSMLTWLERRKQTRGAIERFWRVVLVSALDEELDRTDARFGVDVFWKAFLSNRTGYRMGVPTVPLAELYDGCKAAIEKKGGEVTLRAPVRGITIENGMVTGIALDQQRTAAAGAYVLALPHATLAELLPAAQRAHDPVLRHLEKIKDAPITGVHFWFDRQIMDEPFVTLLDTHTQWIFNKTMLYGSALAGDESPAGNTETGALAKQYLQMVISASYDLIPKSRQEIIDLVLREVRQALPKAREAQLVKGTVIKETTATFSPEPGVDRWRPAQQTSIERLFLAGDWTATGWPATMEGAVRSGYLAAEAVLRAAGTPQKVLQGDLPADGLVRWWV